MQAITKLWLLCVLLCGVSRIGQAAPEPPFEHLLERAETVFLARVVSTQGISVTIQCTELLRGKYDGPMTLTRDHGENNIGWAFGWNPRNLLKDGTEFILLSQGDEKRGLPKPMLGHSFDSQGGYRGWTPFPIRRIGKEVYVLGALSFVNVVPYKDWPSGKNWPLGEAGPRLALPRIKRLIEQFPYRDATPMYHWELVKTL